MTHSDLRNHIHCILSSDRPTHGMASESAVLHELETHGDANALHKTISDTKGKAAEKHHGHTGITKQGRKNTANTVEANTNQEHVAQGNFSVYKNACDDCKDNCAEVGDVVYKSDNTVRNIRKHVRYISQRGGAPFRTAGSGVGKNQNDDPDYGSRLCRFIHI